MSEEIKKPTKEEITIGRLKKRLNKANERAVRLEKEAGQRFLKSLASKYLNFYTKECEDHSRTKQKLYDLERKVRDGEHMSANKALEMIRTLLKISENNK